MRTDPDAGIALHTFPLIPGHGPICGGKRLNGTVPDTDTAIDTHPDGFRIMAEHAVERASLKKDGGPVGRTVNI